MAMNTSIIAEIAAVQTAARDLGSAQANVAKRAALALASGVGANQADVVFQDTRTVTASATDALDLNGGGLVDALGNAFAPAKIKALLVVAAAGNTNDVQVVRPASNGVPLFLAAGDGIALKPGAALLWVSPNAAGVAVAAGTGDLLHLINGGAGTSVDYDIIIIGTSA
jgi:hypothetical protein